MSSEDQSNEQLSEQPDQQVVEREDEPKKEVAVESRDEGPSAPEESGQSDGTEEVQEKRSWLREWGPTIALPIFIALFVHAFVMEAFIVPTGSMLNTIQLNDRVWSEKVSYHFRSPQKGDVILFKSPAEEGVTLLKRVIATEGQTVDLVDGKVVVDGEVLDEPYVEDRPSYPLTRFAPGVEPLSYPLVVPEGHLWLMGDNRTNSLDSRYYGPIPTSSVVARAFCTYWPPEHIRTL